MFIRAMGLLLVLGCAASLPVRADDFQVTVGGSAGQRTFVPADLTVQVGDTVTFTNAGGFHNAASDPGSVTTFRCANGCDDDGAGGSGNPDGSLWTFTITLDSAGTVAYHCEVHGTPGSGMHGTITVEGANPPPPVAVVTPDSFDFTVLAGEATSDTLNIANTGDVASELDFTIGEAANDCTSTSDIPWLSASPTTGTVGGGGFVNVDVSANSNGLAAGDYSALLCVGTNDAVNPLISVPVSLTVTPADRIFAGGFDGP